MSHLPPDRAANVQVIIDAHAAAMKRLRDDSTRARLSARPIFIAPRFDAAAYARAQQALLAADDALHAERLKQLADIAAILSPQERAEIVARAREHEKRTHSGHR
jgi:Spy/CpxP family protein refolding chaperone